MKQRWIRRIATLAVSSVVVVLLGTLAIGEANGKQSRPAKVHDLLGCSLTVTPDSGPVGTEVVITGSTVGCPPLTTTTTACFSGPCTLPYWGPSGVLFENDLGANVVPSITTNPFKVSYTIPATLGPFDTEGVPAPNGGGPVRPGKALFEWSGGYELSAIFTVTSAPAQWTDYVGLAAHMFTRNLSTGWGPPSPISQASYAAAQAGGWLASIFPATNPSSTIGGVALGGPIVGLAVTPDGQGYWEVGSDGGVFTTGDAKFYGSLGNSPRASPIVAMATTPDGGGYWLASADGGVYEFGDAFFSGSLPVIRLNAPIVAIIGSKDGKGYWLVGADGGVFAFGDATFYGSAQPLNLAAGIVSAASSIDGAGYFLLGADGGVYTFGSAQFAGSSVGSAQQYPAVGIASDPTSNGYWILFSNGDIYTYGGAQFNGPAWCIHDWFLYSGECEG